MTSVMSNEESIVGRKTFLGTLCICVWGGEVLGKWGKGKVLGMCDWVFVKSTRLTDGRMYAAWQRV